MLICCWDGLFLTIHRENLGQDNHGQEWLGMPLVGHLYLCFSQIQTDNPNAKIGMQMQQTVYSSHRLLNWRVVVISSCYKERKIILMS